MFPKPKQVCPFGKDSEIVLASALASTKQYISKGAFGKDSETVSASALASTKRYVKQSSSFCFSFYEEICQTVLKNRSHAPSSKKRFSSFYYNLKAQKYMNSPLISKLRAQEKMFCHMIFQFFLEKLF
jgi:hypothetical protein